MRRVLHWFAGVSDYSFRWFITAWLIAASAVGAWGFYHDVQVENAEIAEDRDDDAKACVTDWRVYVSVKAAIERSTAAGARAGAEALIRAASNPTPEEVENFRRLVGEAVAEETGPAVEVIAEPICDLDAAEARLREE